MIALAELQISTLLSAASSRQSYARRGEENCTAEGSRLSINPSIRRLLEGVETRNRKLLNDTEVTCLITDSRRVVPGSLFFAIDGLRTDGNLFVEEAVDRGAVAIITEEDLGPHFPISHIQVADVRESLAIISRKFYENPDSGMWLAGITGTNGKTSVSMLTQHLLGESRPVGLLGTIFYDLGNRKLPSFRTTPESVDVYALLAQMVESKCNDAVMEISSHGIDQKRTFGLNLDVAVFLNLSQDHIDYHGTMEAYYQVKKRLFSGETGFRPRVGVVNVNCAYGRRLINELQSSTEWITFGIETKADIRAENIALHTDGTVFDLIWPEGCARICSPLPGRYNVSNLLASIAIVRAKGYGIESIIGRISNFPGVPGRMERIHMGQPYSVLVDYAHTGDALRHACGMLRELTEGRLIVVFGCGGNRDRGKRAPMLRAVLDSADHIFVTSDNPRTEPVEQIFADMREAEGSEKANFIKDRKDAIAQALDLAQEEDCVLIAGKGHETFQEFDRTTVPFDDRQVARECIRSKNIA